MPSSAAQTRLRPIGAWFIGSLAVVAALAGCGGGGSGGSGSDVTAKLLDPTSVDQTVGQDFTTQDVYVRGSVTGDVTTLSGKTLYVSMSGQGALFNPVPLLDIAPTTESFTVQVLGKVAASAGDFSDVLEIHICFDAECRQPMNGSPLKVPYKVKVLRGLDLPSTAPSYTTKFGVALSAQQFTVDLPEGLEWWSISKISGKGSTAEAIQDGSAPDGTVIVKTQVMKPGTYSTKYVIKARSVNGSGGIFEYEKSMLVTYIVEPNASVDYWIEPTSVDITRTYGDEQATTPWRCCTVLGNEGIELTAIGMDYLSHPPAADGNPLANAWWLDDHGWKSEIVCTSGGGGPVPNCLPVGLYTGRDRYQYVKSGVTKVVGIPVNLTVVP